jgi:thioredoxin reductase
MSIEQVIVVGGGVAGCTAALEAARRGGHVMLVDEHPQTPAQMSLDAPYFYGVRLPSVLSDSSAIADRVLGANSLLLECLDAGVNVLTNTIAWANFVPGRNLTYSRERRLGLADAERSWLVSYEHLILAPGARDLVLSFPGWHLPGVLGAEAASALLGKYQALGGTRAVILGSGNTGLRLAKQLIYSGVQVAAIVDVAARTRGDPALSAELEASGVQFILSTVIESAFGDREIEGVRLRSVGPELQPGSVGVTAIPCDTVCIAIAVVPNIELAAQTGCELEFQCGRGGWVPATDPEMRSSIPYIYVVGDGAGVDDRMLLSTEIAVEQAKTAVNAIAERRAGTDVVGLRRPQSQPADDGSASAPMEWLRAFLAAGGADVVVCQCEDVTRSEVVGVKAPRYLGASENSRAGPRALGNNVSQDFVKRMTRAGMGHCQGKRCRDHVALLLAHVGGTDLSKIGPATYRAPVRPLPLNIAAAPDESEEIERTWPVWFQPLNESEIS